MSKIKYLLIVVCLFLIAENTSAIPMESKDTLYRLSQHEIDELNKLYESTGGDYWSNSSGWPIENIGRTKQAEIPYGLGFLYTNEIVSENEEQIVFSLKIDKIDFSGGSPEYKGNNLRGKLPNLDLQNLTGIALANNGLTGEIPNFNLPNLKQLLMSNNKFEGEIPDFSETDLSSLELDRNKLIGELPNFNLPRLRYLGVGNNRLTGQIPDYKLQGLKILNLHNNQFTGEVPDFDLPILEELFVNNNKFTFGNLESNINKYKTYAYYYQDTTLPITQNDNKLKVTVDGSSNTYTWFLEENEVSSGISSSYRPSQTGIYHCEVTNSLLPNLTLSSSTINVLTVGIATEDQDRFYNYLYTLPPYPQPASSGNIKIPIYWRLGNPVSTGNIKIYNTMGVEIIQENKITIQGISNIHGEIIWDVSGVGAGIYFLEIHHGTSTRIVKIMLE